MYKLLTGRSPHESETRTSQPGEVIEGRQNIPAASRLNPDFPVDVDYILRKALRVEPEERYDSIESLAGDVRAFLESSRSRRDPATRGIGFANSYAGIGLRPLCRRR